MCNGAGFGLVLVQHIGTAHNTRLFHDKIAWARWLADADYVD